MSSHGTRVRDGIGVRGECPGWTRRIAWFLAQPRGTRPPHQWTTARRGGVRCARCGEPVAGRLADHPDRVPRCATCAPEVAAATSAALDAMQLQASA